MEERFSDLGEAKTELGLVRYEALKEAYRLSGVKARIPCSPGARELLEYMRSRGWKIIIVSARPYERYLRILPDTLRWLKRHGLPFDLLYFDQEKDLRLASRFPRIGVFIDDDWNQCLSVARLGVPCFYVTPGDVDNQHPNVTQVPDLVTLRQHMENQRIEDTPNPK